MTRSLGRSSTGSPLTSILGVSISLSPRFVGTIWHGDLKDVVSLPSSTPSLPLFSRDFGPYLNCFFKGEENVNRIFPLGPCCGLTRRGLRRTGWAHRQESVQETWSRMWVLGWGFVSAVTVSTCVGLKFVRIGDPTDTLIVYLQFMRLNVNRY